MERIQIPPSLGTSANGLCWSWTGLLPRHPVWHHLHFWPWCQYWHRVQQNHWFPYLFLLCCYIHHCLWPGSLGKEDITISSQFLFWCILYKGERLIDNRDILIFYLYLLIVYKDLLIIFLELLFFCWYLLTSYWHLLNDY